MMLTEEKCVVDEAEGGGQWCQVKSPDKPEQFQQEGGKVEDSK